MKSLNLSLFDMVLPLNFPMNFYGFIPFSDLSKILYLPMKSVTNKVRNMPWYDVFAKVNNRAGSSSLFIITSENYYNKVNVMSWLELKQAADNETYEQLKRL